MRTRATLAALTALAVSTPGMAAVDVRVSGQSVDIQASNAPLAEILDRLSKQIQMKVVYDGAPPRQMLTLDLRGRTPVEAVTAALEGQGVNYALSMDPTGTRVETLLVSGTAPATAHASAAPDERRAFAREIPQEAVQEEPEPAAEDESQAAAPADTTAGLVQQGLIPAPGGAGGKDAAPEVAAPPDAGLGGFTASPFAPSVVTKQAQPSPQPQATPPPFNP